jgi:putative nucleotidyltransferase with HDIG domain
MKIPSKHECYRLICEMKMLDHIVAHSLQVCRVAVHLVDQLAAGQTRVNRDLVQASALLHDITKTRSFKTRENHAFTGAQLLSSLGYAEVGAIVGQHVKLNQYFKSDTPTEAEIVNYADKRVLHDRVVSLDKRMRYIQEKYGKKPEQQQRIQMLWQKTEVLEDRLFNGLSISPDDLNSHFKTEDYQSDMLDFRKACNPHET